MKVRGEFGVAKIKKTFIAIALLVAIFAAAPSVFGQSNTVTVSFSTTNATPLNQGFAGFTTEILATGVEYKDTNMQQVAAQLSPGWLLYPGGTSADAFDWQSGLSVQSWIDTVGMYEAQSVTASNICQDTYEPLIGKGGAQITDFSTMAQNLSGSRIIVCFNGFTDTAESAGAFAAFALSNHIPVAVWELCNEPYALEGADGFFTNGTDYANKMQPFAAAIKAADSNALVAVFFSDPARSGMAWDNDLENYTNQYWDAVVYHHYPSLPANASFADLMALDNGQLVSNTSSFVTNVLINGNSNTNLFFFETEFAPCQGDGLGGQNPPTSTLYGGIYGAEYVVRLSSVPRMYYAGSYQLVNGSGVDMTNSWSSAVDKAAQNDYVTNTVGLPFGYFLSAQGSGEAVAYWALNRSTAVYPTTFTTNGPTVFTDTNGSGTIPAIYAQAYQGGNGRRYVVLTNKGSNAVPVEIMQDDEPVTNQLLDTFVTGSDPSVVNSNPPSNNVVIQSVTTNNPVTVPEYSVVRLEWTAFTVPQPVLNLTVSNSTRTLRWAGLTNVTYDVQWASNVAGAWETLSKVTSSQTNFSFNDPDVEAIRYYRLAVQ